MSSLMTSPPEVLISECGPRDGLQILSQIMPTEQKKQWIAQLHQAGLREIEVCSFVPARLMPQMADAKEIVAFAKTLPGLTVLTLAPNLRGAVDAIAAGADKLTIPVSASIEHSRANVRKTPEEQIEMVRQIVEYRNEHAPHVSIEANVSVAFGCSIQGAVDESSVIRMAVELVNLGADASGLSDTTGYANPRQTQRLFSRLISEIPDHIGGAHMHNNRGLGLANYLAAYEAGARIFDSSTCGLGGCPHAPGAAGNVVTEDLVFMFESMGVATGVDLDRLLDSRAILQQALPDVPLYGMVQQAGLPKGYVRGEPYPPTAYMLEAGHA